MTSFAACDDDGLQRCPACRRIDRPFERAVAYGSYEEGLRELIHLLKFNGVRPAARILGRMLAEAIVVLDDSFTQDEIAVIPVPLYKSKRRQRGFNQAEVVADAAIRLYAGRARMHLATGILQRTRETHSQIGLTSHQRRENLRGAFTVSDAPAIRGREVLLVDDVYTTGTTATECARVLRRAGSSKVWVATVARTLKLASKHVLNRADTDAAAASEMSESHSFAIEKAVGL
jgi:ComF family protein